MDEVSHKHILNDSEEITPQSIPRELYITFCSLCRGTRSGIAIWLISCRGHSKRDPQLTYGHAVRFPRADRSLCWHKHTIYKSNPNDHEGEYEVQINRCKRGCHKKTTGVVTNCRCPCLICRSHDQPIHTVDLKVPGDDNRAEMMFVCECDIEGASCICSCERCTERNNHPGIKPCIRK